MILKSSKFDRFFTIIKTGTIFLLITAEMRLEVEKENL